MRAWLGKNSMFSFSFSISKKVMMNSGRDVNWGRGRNQLFDYLQGCGARWHSHCGARWHSALAPQRVNTRISRAWRLEKGINRACLHVSGIINKRRKDS